MVLCLVNLTPDVISLWNAEGDKEVFRLVPSGIIAHYSVEIGQDGQIGDIPIFRPVSAKIKGLPFPIEGFLFVVESLLRRALSERLDLASLGEPVHDAKGKPIGYKGLVLNRVPNEVHMVIEA